MAATVECECFGMEPLCEQCGGTGRIPPHPRGVYVPGCTCPTCTDADSAGIEELEAAAAILDRARNS